VTLDEVYDEEVTSLYRKFMPNVHGFLCSMGCDRGLAEEITDDAFMGARRQWTRVRDYDQPESYVFKIAMHERYRRQKIYEDNARDLRPDPEEPVSVRREDPAQRVADQAAIHQALRQLPRSLREAVLLRDYAGLSEARTAEIMDVGVGTVKRYTSVGRRRLRELLREFRPREGGSGR
jgi:RNA polymerase sigma factor (sigma-70 family)